MTYREILEESINEFNRRIDIREDTSNKEYISLVPKYSIEWGLSLSIVLTKDNHILFTRGKYNRDDIESCAKQLLFDFTSFGISSIMISKKVSI